MPTDCSCRAHDERRHPRRVAWIDATLWREGEAGPTTGTLIDLSEGGASVQVPGDAWLEGERLELVLGGDCPAYSCRLVSIEPEFAANYLHLAIEGPRDDAGWLLALLAALDRDSATMGRWQPLTAPLLGRAGFDAVPIASPGPGTARGQV